MGESLKKINSDLNMNKIKLQKIKLKMDINMLTGILAFIYKDSVLRTRKALNNTFKLFNMIDYSVYNDNEDLLHIIWVIRTSLEARLVKGFENDIIIKQYCKEHIEANPITDSIVDDIENLKISYDEIKYIIKGIDDRVKFGYTVTLKELYKEILDEIDNDNYRSYKAIEDDLYQIATSIINLKRNVNSLDSDDTFSLRDEIFETIVSDSVKKLKDKNKVFLTGIKRLNTILSPGYISKRLYMYLAFPGGGKSQMLLKAALDIKKYNNVIPKDPDKIPSVLLILMENDIDESVERLFNMCVSSDDIRNYTEKQIIRKLKEEGNLKITDKSNVDIIIKYYPNRSIDTNDLYGIIKDLDDSGSEVIALIIDYVKRLKPAERANSEKEELKNITNELKTLAKTLDIPVITAQQLNRTAASVVDNAIQNKKEDVTRLVGRDGVASAWEIIENSDVVIIINQEVKIDTDDVFLTFKLLKRRYRSSETSEKLKKLDYFNHPYEKGNTIKLIDDIDLAKSVSSLSLSSQFMSLEDTKKGNKYVVEREDKSIKKDDFLIDMDSFDVAQFIN